MLHDTHSTKTAYFGAVPCNPYYHKAFHSAFYISTVMFLGSSPFFVLILSEF